MTCKYCNQPSPKEYYELAMALPEYKFKIFTIFGRTAEQLLEALKFYDERKSQMTIEEAHIKLAGLGYETKEGLKYSLEVLQALGFINFDGPKTEKEKIEKLLVEYGYPSADRILFILEKNGYVINKRS